MDAKMEVVAMLIADGGIQPGGGAPQPDGDA